LCGKFLTDTAIQGLQVTKDLVPLVTKDDQQGFCQHVENIVKNFGNILGKNVYIVEILYRIKNKF
jgi:hypothetical protein